MAELGKIEKPEAERFRGKRKLYLVPLIFCGKEAPVEYVDRFTLYWQQVSQHIANLESKIDRIKHVYHESIAESGEEGLKVIEKICASSYEISREKGKSSAVIEATEDRELVEESIDWERSLLMGFVSEKAARVVSQLYMEVTRKRYEYIAKKIDETLKEDEVGVLFIREGHMVQFPKDIEVFSVAPPALDDIHRWQRDRIKSEEEKEKVEKAENEHA